MRDSDPPSIADMAHARGDFTVMLMGIGIIFQQAILAIIQHTFFVR